MSFYIIKMGNLMVLDLDLESILPIDFLKLFLFFSDVTQSNYKCAEQSPAFVLDLSWIYVLYYWRIWGAMQNKILMGSQ